MVEISEIRLNGRAIPQEANHSSELSGLMRSGLVRLWGTIMTAELHITERLRLCGDWTDTEMELIINNRPRPMT
jgi:hypothetical protein